MKTKKLSIAAQLFLFILCSAIIVALIVGSVAYSNMGNFLQKKCKDDVMEIAVIAADGAFDSERQSEFLSGRRIGHLCLHADAQRCGVVSVCGGHGPG